MDIFSDDEGDKDAQEAFLKSEAAAGERQALKDMVRRVREGFGEERGGRGRGANARGNLRLDGLTAADKSSRKEARRLGLLNRCASPLPKHVYMCLEGINPRRDSQFEDLRGFCRDVSGMVVFPAFWLVVRFY